MQLEALARGASRPSSQSSSAFPSPSKAIEENPRIRVDGEGLTTVAGHTIILSLAKHAFDVLSGL